MNKLGNAFIQTIRGLCPSSRPRACDPRTPPPRIAVRRTGPLPVCGVFVRDLRVVPKLAPEGLRPAEPPAADRRPQDRTIVWLAAFSGAVRGVYAGSRPRKHDPRNPPPRIAVRRTGPLFGWRRSRARSAGCTQARAQGSTTRGTLRCGVPSAGLAAAGVPRPAVRRADGVGRAAGPPAVADAARAVRDRRGGAGPVAETHGRGDGGGGGQRRGHGVIAPFFLMVADRMRNR